MFILGLQGSPRKNGNTNDLLLMFMEEARKKYGAVTQIISPGTLDIQPCKELIVCEKKGYCPIKDDMDKYIYALIKKADIIVLASPVFFYGVTAQLKALIDRCQMFWARKYKFNLTEPNLNNRQGFLLSCGASGGTKLFEGLELTAKIYFDAISAKYRGSLTYRHIEDIGEMALHATVKEDIRQAIKGLCEPFLLKKKILFVSRKDACRSQIAAAFFRFYDKRKTEVFTTGYDAAPEVFSETIKVMAEKHLDLKYIYPSSLTELNKNQQFDKIIYIGNGAYNSGISALESSTMAIDYPDDLSLKSIRNLRDEIESRIKILVSSD